MDNHYHFIYFYRFACQFGGLDLLTEFKSFFTSHVWLTISYHYLCEFNSWKCNITYIYASFSLEESHNFPRIHYNRRTHVSVVSSALLNALNGATASPESLLNCILLSLTHLFSTMKLTQFLSSTNAWTFLWYNIITTALYDVGYITTEKKNCCHYVL